MKLRKMAKKSEKKDAEVISVKDMGVGICAVTKMEASPETILGLLK